MDKELEKFREELVREELTYMVEKNKELEAKIAVLQTAVNDMHDLIAKAIKELKKI